MTTRSAHRQLGAVVLATLLAAACTSEESQPLTAKVTRTSVTSTVTATGTLQAITEQKLGFPKGGRLVELNVTVGQQVGQGHVLARVDDFEARHELEAARAHLAQEQAVLNRIRGGNEVQAAEEDVKRAEEVLAATEEQAEVVDEANESAVEEAEHRVDKDEEIHDNTEDRSRCDDDSEDGDSDSVARYSDDSGDCAEVDESDRRVTDSEADLQAAEERREVDNAEQELAIEKARRDLAEAEHEAEAARNERPHNIDEQAAIVRGLQVEVESAQRAVDDTVLKAPVAGKIASINGTLGEFIGGGSGTTPLAPGGRVPLPEDASRVSSGDDVGGDSEPPGGGAFIVLDDVNTFQIVAPFAETDASRIQAGQEVQVTFDAVPDLTRAGSVTSIAPTGTDFQGVTSYYAVIVLGELDPRLMHGQTASAHVVVDQMDNTLVVPNAAIQQSGQTGVVTVKEPDGTHRQVQVELGLSGDSVTQIVSGLREGQEVVIAPAE
jgi:HlyD family secretion protein